METPIELGNRLPCLGILDEIELSQEPIAMQSIPGMDDQRWCQGKGISDEMEHLVNRLGQVEFFMDGVLEVEIHVQGWHRLHIGTPSSTSR
jgi:hypothetical protein